MTISHQATQYNLNFSTLGCITDTVTQHVFQGAAKKLWIPDSAKREAYELYQATVLQTGPGAFRKHDGKRNPCEVKKGDRVLCYWTAVEMDVTSFFPKGEEHRIISEKSIQAVLDA